MRLLTREQRWTAMFDFYDLDRNGHLSEEDILIAYEKLLAMKGIPIDSEPARAILGAMRDAFAEDVMRSDRDGDGRVTLEEWHAHYGELLVDAGNGALLPSVELLRGARNGFAVYDLDSDGRISRQDYLGCARIFAPDVQEDALVAHWAMLTGAFGTDGALDFDEFLVLFLQVWCSTRELPFWFPAE